MTLEAWTTPATNEFGRLLGIAGAGGTAEVNAMLVANAGQHEAYLRTTTAAGLALSSGVPVRTSRTHVVFTRAVDGARRFCVDGVSRAARRRSIPTDLRDGTVVPRARP